MTRKFDNARAYREGWGLFNADGTLAIQRLDDPRSVDPSYPEEPVFDGDLSARQFVTDQSRESEYHRLALSLEGTRA